MGLLLDALHQVSQGLPGHLLKRLLESKALSSITEDPERVNGAIDPATVLQECPQVGA